MKPTSKTPRTLAVTAALPPTPTLPALFTACSLAKYLGVPVSTVAKLKIPRLVLGHRTKLYALADVLKRIEELKQEGAA